MLVKGGPSRSPPSGAHERSAQTSIVLSTPGDREPREERSARAPLGREGLADEDHVGAHLEEREIARLVQAPVRVVVPEVLVLVRILLLLGEAQLAGGEVVGALAHDGEREAAVAHAPEHRRDAEETERGDEHRGIQPGSTGE